MLTKKFFTNKHLTNIFITDIIITSLNKYQFRLRSCALKGDAMRQLIDAIKGVPAHRKSLDEALRRIAAELCVGAKVRVKVEYVPFDPDSMGPPLFCLVETRRNRWFPVLSSKRVLLTVEEPWSSEGTSCTVYDPAALDVVERELDRYANEVGLKGVSIIKQYTA